MAAASQVGVWIRFSRRWKPTETPRNGAINPVQRRERKDDGHPEWNTGVVPYVFFGWHVFFHIGHVFEVPFDSGYEVYEFELGIWDQKLERCLTQ